MYLKINHIDILTKEVLISLSKPNTFKTYDLQKCSKEQTKNVTKFFFFLIQLLNNKLQNGLS